MLLRDRRARPWTERHWPRTERYVSLFLLFSPTTILPTIRNMFLPSLFLSDTPLISCVSIPCVRINEMMLFCISTNDICGWQVTGRYRDSRVLPVPLSVERFTYNLSYCERVYSHEHTYVRYTENVNKIKVFPLVNFGQLPCVRFTKLFCENQLVDRAIIWCKLIRLAAWQFKFFLRTRFRATSTRQPPRRSRNGKLNRKHLLPKAWNGEHNLRMSVCTRRR